MIKYFISLFLVVIVQLTVFAQKPVTICGNAFSFQGKYYSVSVLNTLKKAVGDEFSYLAQVPIDSSAKFKFKLLLKQPQMVVVRYMNKRLRLYLNPGDSVHISFSKIDRVDTVTTGIITRIMKFKEKSVVTGNDQPRLAFFQMLDDQTGSIDDVRFKIGKDSIADFNQFKSGITNQYQQRLKVLETVAAAHHFKPDLISAAKSEITGAFLDALLQTIYVRFDWRKMPEYFKEAVDEQITWPKVRSSSSYQSFVYGYLMYFDKYIKQHGRVTEDVLTDKFNTITRLKDDSVRNYYLTILMSKALKKKTKLYRN